jgi:hypothetical protein
MDPLTDGRRIECVQWRRQRFIEVIAGLFTQQPPAHEQAQDPLADDTEERLDLLIGRRFGSNEPNRAAGLSREDAVDRQGMEVQVQVECAADRHPYRLGLRTPRTPGRFRKNADIARPIGH